MRRSLSSQPQKEITEEEIDDTSFAFLPGIQPKDAVDATVDPSNAMMQQQPEQPPQTQQRETTTFPHQYPINSSPTTSPLIERLPMDKRHGVPMPMLVPTSDLDYSPQLTYSQLQHIQSGVTDINVHDGRHNVVLKNGTPLPVFGKYGLKNMSHDQIFEWIEQTEHLYRETYKDLMKPDPALIVRDPDAHLRKFPTNETEFFASTQLPTNDIKSWNLLLNIQAYHSDKKFLSTTVSGSKKKQQAFLQILETFQKMQSLQTRASTEYKPHSNTDTDTDTAVTGDHDHDHHPLSLASESPSHSSQTADLIPIHADSDSDADDRSVDVVDTRAAAAAAASMELNMDTYDIMLKAMAIHGQPGMCIELLSELGHSGYNPSLESYVHLLRAYVNSHQCQEAHDILNYMRANSPQQRVDLECYNQVLNGYLRNHRGAEALRLFNHMMQVEGEHPNTKTYTIMMEYYRQTRNINGAVDILREMEDRGYLPNQKTYAAAILAAAYGDEEDSAYRKMFELYDEMVVTKEIPPTARTFQALLTGCGRMADIESATKCLQLMDRMRIPRTGKIYRYYLNCIANTLRKRKYDITIGATRNLHKEHLIVLGESIVKQMQQSSDVRNDRDTGDEVGNGLGHGDQYSGQTNQRLLRSVMGECTSSAPQFKDYENVSDWMVSLKDSVDIHVINALLNIYTASNDTQRAVMFLKTMHNRFPDVVANKQTFRLVWECLTRVKRFSDWPEIQNVFHMYSDNNRGWKHSIDKHRAMVRLSAHFNDPDACARYLQLMDENGMVVRDRDRAQLALCMGTNAEKCEAHRRFYKETVQKKKDNQIRRKARKSGFKELSFKRFTRHMKVVAEKTAGVRLEKGGDSRRTVGKVFWNCNRTLGQLDDPW